MAQRESGNGEVCPDDPEHGRMYVLASGRQWCAHSDHTSNIKASDIKEGAHTMGLQTPGPAPKPGGKPTRATRAAADKPTTEGVKERVFPLCNCGCGDRTKGGRFIPGHDARFHSRVKALEAQGLPHAEAEKIAGQGPLKGKYLAAAEKAKEAKKAAAKKG